MSGWTPGPWRLETVRTQVGICHKVGPFVREWGRNKETHACIYDDGAIMLADGSVRGGDATLQANARLIAKAWLLPELVEALREGQGEFTRERYMAWKAKIVALLARYDEAAT